MNAFAEFAHDIVEVVVARLDVPPETVRAALGVLSDAERERTHRLTFDRHRRRFTVARALLRQLLAQRLGVPPKDVELTYGVHGKPALAKHHAHLRFNLSHCEDLAIYAFTRGREIGVDIEAVRALRGADDIALRFFSRRENEAYRALDARDKPLGFFNCWTRKEAFIKALGEGLSHPLDRFDVSLAPHEPARIVSVDGVPGERCGWRMVSFSPAPGFLAALAVETA